MVDREKLFELPKPDKWEPYLIPALIISALICVVIAAVFPDLAAIELFFAMGCSLWAYNEWKDKKERNKIK